MNLNSTPNANRLHIGIFGRRNSGKSTLINALTNQQVAIVSDVAGTTADPVYKAMEIHGIGPCVIIDTAGFDDEGYLGSKRVEQTRKAADKTDIAIIVVTSEDMSLEVKWYNLMKERKTPSIVVINKSDVIADIRTVQAAAVRVFGTEPIVLSAALKTNIQAVIDALIRAMPEDFEAESITGRLVRSKDTVMLVMPQDIQAPKGRLILPQVQTIRDLLDKRCTVISTTADRFEQSLKVLSSPPDLIITDSQVFGPVYKAKPAESRLTSFSVLFAAYKGDIEEYVRGAQAIDGLTSKSRVLIAEACTHAPLSEDIGRVKIPRILRKIAGENLSVDVAAGADFPKDLAPYDLIIHCGGCMFNRKFIMSRIEAARQAGVPITNYGIAIAYVNGILDKISY